MNVSSTIAAETLLETNNKNVYRALNVSTHVTCHSLHFHLSSHRAQTTIYIIYFVYMRYTNLYVSILILFFMENVCCPTFFFLLCTSLPCRSCCAAYTVFPKHTITKRPGRTSLGIYTLHYKLSLSFHYLCPT